MLSATSKESSKFAQTRNNLNDFIPQREGETEVAEIAQEEKYNPNENISEHDIEKDHANSPEQNQTEAITSDEAAEMLQSKFHFFFKFCLELFKVSLENQHIMNNLSKNREFLTNFEGFLEMCKTLHIKGLELENMRQSFHTGPSLMASRSSGTFSHEIASSEKKHLARASNALSLDTLKRTTKATSEEIVTGKEEHDDEGRGCIYAPSDSNNSRLRNSGMPPRVKSSAKSLSQSHGSHGDTPAHLVANQISNSKTRYLQYTFSPHDGNINLSYNIAHPTTEKRGKPEEDYSKLYEEGRKGEADVEEEREDEEEEEEEIAEALRLPPSPHKESDLNLHLNPFKKQQSKQTAEESAKKSKDLERLEELQAQYGYLTLLEDNTNNTRNEILSNTKSLPIEIEESTRKNLNMDLSSSLEHSPSPIHYSKPLAQPYQHTHLHSQENTENLRSMLSLEDNMNMKGYEDISRNRNEERDINTSESNRMEAMEGIRASQNNRMELMQPMTDISPLLDSLTHEGNSVLLESALSSQTFKDKYKDTTYAAFDTKNAVDNIFSNIAQTCNYNEIDKSLLSLQSYSQNQKY